MTTLSVSDAAAGTNPIEVTLDAAHGTLTLGDTTNLTINGQGTDALTLTGTQAAIDAALANGLTYAPTLNSQFADVLTITASDLGHNGTGVPLSTTQDVGIVIAPANSIANGATYTVSAPSGDTIAFAGATGTLDLAQPSSFTGEIAGITGTGDVLDLHGFAAGTTAVTGSGSFNSVTDTTTLTVTDLSDHLTETFTLAGNLSNSTWTVTDDHNGGVDIVDPPAPAHMAVVPPAASAPAATSTIVVSGPDQILTGNAASDSFVFNFTGVGHATVTNFDPATDTHQFGRSTHLRNLQAALNATHDDGHGDTVIALDAHDTDHLERDPQGPVARQRFSLCLMRRALQQPRNSEAVDLVEHGARCSGARRRNGCSGRAAGLFRRPAAGNTCHERGSVAGSAATASGRACAGRARIVRSGPM